ncbi:MAG TPA: LarC family nickel insertion protein, partial [Acidimicrobiales bacterium]|nr:LarC family nickel insertion protein [Acidimicrobiales bacterium]
ALDTFARLAEVEGRLHNRPPAHVHFHEVGGVDAIIDIVGTAVALEILGVDEISADAVAQGRGVHRSAHGLLPNPSPAVVELLRGAPTYGVETPVELTTPTGAALLAALCRRWGTMPAMDITAVGRGAGSRDIEGAPNVAQVVIGSAAAEASASGHPVVVLESNVDDVTGEVLAHAVRAVLDAGAHDAWLTPIVGKKGRPAHVVTAVVDPALVAAVRGALVTETGTLGVRCHTVERWTAERQVVEVSVDGHVVRVKRSAARLKAEHDDAARVAAHTGRPLHEVARRAEEAARRLGDGDGGGAPPVPRPPAG